MVGSRLGNGFDIPADERNESPDGDLVVDVPIEVFYQSRNEKLPVQNRAMMGMVIEPKPGAYALTLSCGTNARIQIGHLETL